jgi:glyoxylase-like metal-dependent hydrolase (beta-lactamase superfamily II)
MLKQIKEGIYQLVVKYPFGMREVNSYLFRGENGYTVVDTGSYANKAIEIWRQALDTVGPLEKVILTHAHPDHIGLAKWFQDQYHVPVYISNLGYNEIKRFAKSLNQDKQAELKAFFLKHDGAIDSENYLLQEADAYHFEPDGTFEENEIVRLGDYHFKAIWTPGHSPDHFSFYDQENQVMVIGDHVLEAIAPVIMVTSEQDGNPLADYLESLNFIGKYPTKLSLPGHGNVILDLPTRIAEIRNSHMQRMEQLLHFLNEEKHTAGQLCEKIYGPQRSQDLFTSQLMMTLARLTFLERKGEIKRVINDEKILFTIG